MPTTKKKQQQRAAAGRKAKDKPVEVTRDIIYDEVSVVIHQGETAIDGEAAMKYLGWEEEEKNEFGSKFLLKNDGKKVRCTNNVTNRPLYNSNISSLKQDILRGHWRLNGEPIIIGKTGLILNGQHTLLALIMAVFEWVENPERYPFWTTEPTIDKLVVLGIEEDDQVVNTMDTCKPRSLTDVIYRTSYFKSLPSSAHRKASNMTAYAIKKMWETTGTHENPYGVKTNHSEMIAYLEKHRRILEAVKHIYEEDDDSSKIGKWISPGYAAAALYLMGSCETEATTYYEADNPNENLIDFSRWDKACEFFVELASGGDKLKAVRDSIVKLVEQGSDNHSSRWAIIAKAWHPFLEGKPITAKTVSLKFEMKEETRVLVENPLMGGIDVGDEGLNFAATKEQAANGSTDDPTVEEIEERKKEVRKGKGKAPREAKRKGKEWKKNDVAWCHEFHGPKEEAVLVVLTSDPYETVTGVEVMCECENGENGAMEVKLEQLSLAQFELKN